MAQSSLSDEALLTGLASGEPDAAAAFTRRFQSRVYGLARTIVRDPGVAEDVAQETFLRAWRHARNYDARRGRVAAWLLTITRNLAIDTLRLKAAEPLDPDMLAARLQRAGEAGPSIEDRQPPDERERVRAAIARLPDEQRRALVLAAYLGRTAREVSEIEQIPLGTAKTRIRAGMLKLHEALEADLEL